VKSLVKGRQWLATLLFPDDKLHENGGKVMKGVRSLICFVLLTMLAGCASFTSPARKHELDASKPYWLDYDAYRRGTLFLPISTAHGKTFRTCAEPPPDVAMQLIDKFTAKGGNGEISAEASAEISQNALQLAQRTQTIQFLREALFRLCEISLNTEFASDKIAEMYNIVLLSAKSMAEAEKSTAEKAAIDANTRLVNAKKESARVIDEIKSKNKAETK
jgi:hypothetical protein